mgnify:FL=1|tara:strand:- start:5186 stop:5950 length:765 start_codon:yes stop_codon:yes gene_type:complete
MKKGFRILKFKKDKPIFEVKDVSKTFEGRPILKKLSLKVFPGEIVGLLGPNGAGKSTLFNISIGAESADSGNIFINGKSINQIPIHLRSKQGLGYLPQTRCLFDTLSTYNNIYGLVQIHEKDDKKAKELTESLLEKFNLVHLRSVNAGVLSGGEAKRLSLARLMITNPKIVLIDEIWSMVDPLVVQDMQKYILQIQSQGVSCILTDHSVNTLFETTDRNYLIDSGQIIAEGTKRELLKNSEAVKKYFGTGFNNY